MKEPKHTKGPWRIGYANKPGGTVTTEVVGNDGRYVATIVPHRNRIAHARLITSAPDLLATLQAALAQVESGGDVAWDAARAAILKATGEGK